MADEKTIDPKLKRFLEGVSSSVENLQEKAPDGDPQATALRQFLRPEGKPTIVVDYGSGNGVLAHLVVELWPNDPPEYWAVDFEGDLEQLRIPLRIHNASKKFTVDDFIKQQLPKHGSRISVVVVRNVLHHLSIDDMAQLIVALNHSLSPPAEVYVQDMELLAIPERNNAGWHGDLFADLLGGLGVPCDVVQERSRHGTIWFWAIMRPTGKPITIDDARQAVLRARARQKDRLRQALELIAEDYTKTGDFTFLSNELASLDRLLAKYEKNPPKAQEFVLEQLRLPTLPSQERYDYAVETSASTTERSALSAVLSRKGILNFPRLISGTQSFLYFAGYSQRSLFAEPANAEALRIILAAGRVIKVLVVDPESQAAQLRAREPSYREPDEFLGDVKFTIREGLAFRTTLTRAESERFELKQSTRVPACSYFLLDNLCFVSLYARRITGSRAPCLVFQSNSKALSSYYQLMREDFDAVFGEASVPDGARLD